MLNSLRAGVLGANDGIVSVAGLVMGVAGASADRTPLFVAGVAGIVSGALSMAVGEYVSVSTQRDAEEAMIAQEDWELATMPDEELDELAQIYEDKGLPADLAREVATHLTQHDALAAHADAELNLDPHDLTSPIAAALSSFLAFTLGALVPVLAALLPPQDLRVPVTAAAVIVALALTGRLGAGASKANPWRSVLRNVLGGCLAMAVTFGVGSLVGTSLT